MSELAARAEVPVATVKYYLREGLMPPGVITGPRRAEYDDSHLRRLRILRMLREVGGAPVSALQLIIDAVDDGSLPTHEVLCQISDALTPELAGPATSSDARGMVDAAVAGVGWDGVRADAAARLRLAALIELLSGEGPLAIDPAVLAYYARFTDELCRAEITLIDTAADRPETLEDMVAGEAVFGELLILLRRLGHEHHHLQRSRAAEGG